MKMIASTKMVKAQRAMGHGKSYGEANIGSSPRGQRRPTACSVRSNTLFINYRNIQDSVTKRTPETQALCRRLVGQGSLRRHPLITLQTHPQVPYWARGKCRPVFAYRRHWGQGKGTAISSPGQEFCPHRQSNRQGRAHVCRRCWCR